MRGTRPWTQFLNHCDTVAQIEGSRLRSAQVSDPRFDHEIERLLLERKGQTSRPPLEGDTAEVRGLRTVSNDLRLLIRELAHVAVPMLEGPETPADRIAHRKKSIGRARISEILARADMEGGVNVA